MPHVGIQTCQKLDIKVGLIQSEKNKSLKKSLSRFLIIFFLSQKCDDNKGIHLYLPQYC